MYKKARCTCKIVVLLIKRIVFVAFPLQSPSSDLSLETAVIPRRNEKQRLCKILGSKQRVLWEMCKLANAYAQFWGIKTEYYV